MMTIDSLKENLAFLNEDIKKKDMLLDKYYASGDIEKFERVEKLRDRNVKERREIRRLIFDMENK